MQCVSVFWDLKTLRHGLVNRCALKRLPGCDGDDEWDLNPDPQICGSGPGYVQYMSMFWDLKIWMYVYVLGPQNLDVCLCFGTSKSGCMPMFWDLKIWMYVCVLGPQNLDVCL
jgi:hypothetical protein